MLGIFLQPITCFLLGVSLDSLLVNIMEMALFEMKKNQLDWASERRRKDVQTKEGKVNFSLRSTDTQNII